MDLAHHGVDPTRKMKTSTYVMLGWTVVLPNSAKPQLELFPLILGHLTDHLKMIKANFSMNWPGFRRVDFHVTLISCVTLVTTICPLNQVRLAPILSGIKNLLNPISTSPKPFPRRFQRLPGTTFHDGRAFFS